MKVKISELGEIMTGNTPSKKDSNYWNSNDVLFVKPDDLQDVAITDIYKSHEYISYCGRSKARIASKDSILVTCIGSIGKVGIAQYEICFNQQINAIKLTDKYFPRYIAYALYANKNRLQAIANAPVVPIINKTQFSNFEFNIEQNIETQKQIAKELSSIDNLINKYKEKVIKYDELVKARFIEMFGDNNKFETAPLDDSVEEMFIGPFGSSLKNECFVDANQGYCMVYEQKHAIKKTMDVDTRYVDEKKYKELRRFTVRVGDIIVSCRGTIGETFIVPENAPLGIMHPSIMKIRLKVDVYNRVFFNELLKTVLERHNADANGSGIKMAITATALGKEYFIKPPIELQNQFASLVEQIDKSKLLVHKGLQELEILKESLMQKYFG